MRFVVYELIDPRSGNPFWCGCGRVETWKSQALLVYSEGKYNWIRTIKAEGLEPEVRQIGIYRSLKEALRAKYDKCQETGQAFRGLRKGLLLKDIRRRGKQAGRHVGPLETPKWRPAHKREAVNE